MDDRSQPSSPVAKGVFLSSCECDICSQQFRKPEIQAEYLNQAYDGKLTDQEAIDRAGETMDNVNELLVHLRLMYSAHAKIIATRWWKKSRNKGEAILLQAGDCLEPKQWKIAEFLSKQGGLSN